MRNHRKFEVFWLAETLALRVYRVTRRFPEDERYGLSSQMRRAAVSIGANIVEGAARPSHGDFLRLLTIAYGSACELEYELSLAIKLSYVPANDRAELQQLASRTCRGLRSFINAIQRMT